MEEVRHQAHEYMRGHVAALFVQFARHRHWGNVRRATVDLPRYYARRALTDAFHGQRPGDIERASMAGHLAGMRLIPSALRDRRHRP
jgi:hypothetical protein